jgi:hypothetical protein
MSQPDPANRENSLRQWLANSSQDWMESQSTLWLPAVPPRSPGPPKRGPLEPRPPTELPRHQRATDALTQQRRADLLLWPSTVGAFLAVGLGFTPSLTGALLAVLTGSGSVAMTTARLARARRPIRGGPTVLWAALVIAAAAVGLGGSTIWTAVSFR